MQNNIKVIFTFGKNDWIINYFCGQEIVDKICEKAFDEHIFDKLPASPSSMHELIIGNHLHAGEYTSFRNVTFAQINNAGHSIGMDQPEAIYKLFSSLVQNQ